MMFEKPLMHLYEYDEGLCAILLFMVQSRILVVKLGDKASRSGESSSPQWEIVWIRVVSAWLAA